MRADDIGIAEVAEENKTSSRIAPGESAREPVAPGRAGASARRAYERQAARREQRIRQRHPKLGGFVLAVTEEPSHVSAWKTGAKGEEHLGAGLDRLADQGVRVLHDRRIPGTRANIDHIAVSPPGVFVLDAKRYKGRPRLKVEGGLFRPRTETLMVGTRKCTALVEGLHKQLRVVEKALESDPTGVGIPLVGMLVFINADWPLIGGDFTIDGVKVAWPRKAVQHITQPGSLDTVQVEALHRRLAEAFPRM